MNKKIKTEYGTVQVTDREKPSKIGKFIFLVSTVISYIGIVTFFTYNLDIAKTTGNRGFAVAGFIICGIYLVVNTIFVLLQYYNTKSKGLKKSRGYATKAFKYITIGLKCAFILAAAFTMLIAAKNFEDVGNAALKALTIFSVLISVFIDIGMYLLKRHFKKQKEEKQPTDKGATVVTAENSESDTKSEKSNRHNKKNEKGK